MDLYNIITKIPYLIMLGIGMVLILQIYVGGLQDISDNIDENSLTEYDSLLAAERAQNNGSRRTVLNFSRFETGYDSCYFEGFNYLNGEYLEFRISSPEVSGTEMESRYGVGCQGTVDEDQSFSMRILLSNKTHTVPATMYIYEN